MINVSDLSLGDISESSHDLVIWCSGYEERATYFPAYMEDKVRGECLVLGFKNDDKPSEKNRSYFHKKWSGTILDIGSRDSVSIIDAIESMSLPDRPHILVDYSSMPRDWYAAIVDVVSRKFERAILDLNYSAAAHVDAIQPSIVENYYTVFGCDSVSVGTAHSSLVVGFGFDGVATLHIVDQYEPDQILAYVANPGSQSGYYQRALNSNQLFIDQYLEGSARKVMSLPLWSVETAIRGLGESIASSDEAGIVVLAPFGPKPFVLASVLLALQSPRISCINSNKRVQTRFAAPAIGELVLTRLDCMGE